MFGILEQRQVSKVRLVTITELVAQHYDAVYRLAFRLSGTTHDAEDITQQAFVDAQRHLHTLRDPASAKAWLCMIARNHFRRGLRDAGPSRTSLDAIDEPAGAMVAEPLDTRGLQTALNQLPTEFRTVLVLFYFENLSYQQIATELGLPIGTVMSRLSRGKQQLRQHLKREEFEVDS